MTAASDSITIYPLTVRCTRCGNRFPWFVVLSPMLPKCPRCYV